ncbi:hypothetical protein AMAG_06095 [Allomyces macrogynus ATCC 38327]|uniref:Cyclin N-terminal domain-containing protein n=1 Tax=Allomyces macrogynus (strain ATCC 38327) TaxID=578462 RepID=A0A0L0SDV7_ALLM3|nr:hypothetical protein AMAG_06095 [Allomyces macrogynus ATCC 38327]|eukprot:KNE60733.1 hypothetical protein AMAG_06095 [Allomyces macrogynus ATCC 38327]
MNTTSKNTTTATTGLRRNNVTGPGGRDHRGQAAPAPLPARDRAPPRHLAPDHAFRARPAAVRGRRRVTGPTPALTRPASAPPPTAPRHVESLVTLRAVSTSPLNVDGVADRVEDDSDEEYYRAQAAADTHPSLRPATRAWLSALAPRSKSYDGASSASSPARGPSHRRSVSASAPLLAAVGTPPDVTEPVRPPSRPRLKAWRSEQSLRDATAHATEQAKVAAQPLADYQAYLQALSASGPQGALADHRQIPDNVLDVAAEVIHGYCRRIADDQSSRSRDAPSSPTSPASRRKRQRKLLSPWSSSVDSLFPDLTQPARTNSIDSTASTKARQADLDAARRSVHFMRRTLRAAGISSSSFLLALYYIDQLRRGLRDRVESAEAPDDDLPPTWDVHDDELPPTPDAIPSPMASPWPLLMRQVPGSMARKRAQSPLVARWGTQSPLIARWRARSASPPPPPVPPLPPPSLAAPLGRRHHRRDDEPLNEYTARASAGDRSRVTSSSTLHVDTSLAALAVPPRPTTPTMLSPTAPDPAATIHWTPPTLFLGALIVAEKMLFDRIYRNADWAVFTRFATRDINRFERAFLSATDWRVAVPPPDAFHAFLRKLQARVVVAKLQRTGGVPTYFDVAVLMGVVWDAVVEGVNFARRRREWRAVVMAVVVAVVAIAIGQMLAGGRTAEESLIGPTG